MSVSNTNNPSQGYTAPSAPDLTIAIATAVTEPEIDVEGAMETSANRTEQMKGLLADEVLSDA